MVASKDFKVAIVGGGIGGLTLAVALSQNGIQIDLFEQAPKFEEIGAGVGIGPNAVRALRSLGLLDDILRIADEPLALRTFIYMSGLPDQQLIYDYPVTDGNVGLGAHRAHFLDALVKMLPPHVAHFTKKCISVIQEDGRVTIAFEDGTVHSADILIGCDGIKSMVRQAVFGKPVHAKFTRTVAFRGLIPEQAAAEALGERILDRPHCLSGPNRHIIAFPIKRKHIVNLVVFVTDRSEGAENRGPASGEPSVVPATQEEMLQYFNGWAPSTLNLLSHIKSPNKWYLHALDPPLNKYVKDGVALLGDAAHSMLPHLGAGAGQAIEDANLLTALLSHPGTNRGNLKAVLKVYEKVRLPRANQILRRSYDAGEIYEHAGPSGGNVEGMRKDLMTINDFIWEHDLQGDIDIAFKLLEKKLKTVPNKL